MDQDARDRLAADWIGLLHGLGEDEARRGFDELAAAYSAPGRFYHNLDHVRAVLDTVDGLADLARDVAAVRLAAWYHDAVYDSRAGDNEERSAALAAERCAGWGLPAPTVETVVRLIRATKTHQADPADVDGSILLDADLAILGAGEDEYDRYAAAIRREYAWVPEDDYRRGRVRVLEGFLRRDRLFQLERMHQRLDAPARRNLRREIAALGA